jgi:hypothetical protein
MLPSSSIRTESLQVIRQAQEEGLTDRRDRAEDDAAVSVYLTNEKVTDALSGYDESGFGIKYSLNKDGSLRVLHGYEPLHHDWSLAELEELTEAGYIKGNPYKILVVLPTGLGAAPQDLFDWLGFMANVFGIGTPSVAVLKDIIGLIRYRKIRKAAEIWTKNGIQYPSQIREFIDTKPGWKLTEVKRRLKLDDEYAIKLLTALGLEPKKDAWQLTHSKKSIANRKKWLSGEKKYIKKLSTYQQD